MTKPNRKQSTKRSSSSSRPERARYESCDSYETYETYEIESTAQTSIYASTQASAKDAMLPSKFQPVYEEDISPSTSCCPRSSVDTFDSTLASDEDLTRMDVDVDNHDENQDIPPLPLYRHQIVDPNVRPSSPQDFAKLFPSMNRLSIRHDDFTLDGNLNLRVDTVVPGRRCQVMQLFHLRMHDLAKRDFSLRRYCRDSGREVCNTKRQYDEAPSHHQHSHHYGHHHEENQDRPRLQRSVSSALKSLGGGRKALARTNTGGSIASTKNSTSNSKQPQTRYSYSYEGDDKPADYALSSFDDDVFSSRQQQKPGPLPTNTIKLEFSNYARVDVMRRGSGSSKRYGFEWWGHRYHWKRVVDKNLGSVSFHLLRDGGGSTSIGTGPAIAHIVPETRDPNQVAVDEEAGGWVPPCHMWISDQRVLDAATDVADVIVATGLSALVDDCIKDRWQVRGGKKVRRFPLPLTSRTVDVEYIGPRTLMQNLLHRRGSEPQPQQPHNPRQGYTVSAY